MKVKSMHRTSSSLIGALMIFALVVSALHAADKPSPEKKLAKPAAKTAAKPSLRFGAVFVPMGERPGYWTPTTTGSAFEFTPILKPIERFRESLVVVSNLDRPPGGTHAVSTSR